MRFLTLFLILAFSSLSFSATYLGNCSVITTPDIYYLDINAFGAPHATPYGDTACIVIESSDVIFDCASYTITNNGTAGHTTGVYINESVTNVTVANCSISDYRDGIGSYGSESFIYGNNLSNELGIRAEGSSNNSIHDTKINSTANGGFNIGMWCTTDCHNNTIRNNNITTNGTIGNYGIRIDTSTNNEILYNTIATNGNSSNNIGILLITSSSGNNVTGNNITTFGLSTNHGINLQGGSSHNIIHQNTVSTDGTGFANIALYILSGTNNTVTSNNVVTTNGTNGNAGIRIETSDFNLVANNNVSTGGGSINNYAILLWNSANFNNVSGNRVETIGAGSHCILVQNAHWNTVADNMVSNCDSFGIVLVSSETNNLTKNTILSGGLAGSSDGILLQIESNDNILTSNNVSNFTDDCYMITGSTNNTLVDNHASACPNQCFELSTNADNNYLENNTATGCLEGFRTFVNSINNDFKDNTAFGNTWNGFRTQDSDGTNVDGLYLYNNNPDLRVEGTGVTVNFSGIIFDNNAGSMVNYTNISFDDFVASGYTMDHATSPGALPGDSFNNKFLNINNITSGVSIDTIAWHWLDSEVGIFDESLFGIYDYNGSGWFVRNETPNTVANTLSVSNLQGFGVFALLHNVTMNVTVPEEPDSGDEPGPGSLQLYLISGCDSTTVTVTDDDDNPLSGTRVVVDEVSSGTFIREIFNGVTDSNGQILFEECSFSAKVRASKSGFSPVEHTETIACAACQSAACSSDSACLDDERCYLGTSSGHDYGNRIGPKSLYQVAPDLADCLDDQVQREVDSDEFFCPTNTIPEEIYIPGLEDGSVDIGELIVLGQESCGGSFPTYDYDYCAMCSDKCIHESDCRGSYSCVHDSSHFINVTIISGTCQLKAPSSCINDSACLQKDEFCISGGCIQIECTSSSDCHDGSYCEETYGFCVEGCQLGNADDVCGYGKYCQVPSDAKEYEILQCVEYDCPAGQYLLDVGGDSPQCVEGCQKKADCESYEYCQLYEATDVGYCVDHCGPISGEDPLFPVPEWECDPNNMRDSCGCDDGQFCSVTDHICHSLGDTCTSDSDCEASNSVCEEEPITSGEKKCIIYELVAPVGPLGANEPNQTYTIYRNGQLCDGCVVTFTGGTDIATCTSTLGQCNVTTDSSGEDITATLYSKENNVVVQTETTELVTPEEETYYDAWGEIARTCGPSIILLFMLGLLVTFVRKGRKRKK